jgi:hypothetical protein
MAEWSDFLRVDEMAEMVKNVYYCVLLVYLLDFLRVVYMEFC